MGVYHVEKVQVTPGFSRLTLCSVSLHTAEVGGSSPSAPTDVVRITTLSLLVSYFLCPIAVAGLFRYSNPSPHLAWAVSGDAV